MTELDLLTARLERVEAENRRFRRMAGVAGVVLLGAVCVGWRYAGPVAFDTLKVHRLEVLVDRGVPVLTLAPMRGNTGGTVILRDQSGDKTSWWETDAGTSRIVFQSPEPKGEGATIAGMASMPGRAQMTLLGAKGGSFTDSVQSDQPGTNLKSPAGVTLFAAPWTKSD